MRRALKADKAPAQRMPCQPASPSASRAPPAAFRRDGSRFISPDAAAASAAIRRCRMNLRTAAAPEAAAAIVYRCRRRRGCRRMRYAAEERRAPTMLARLPPDAGCVFRTGDRGMPPASPGIRRFFISAARTGCVTPYAKPTPTKADLHQTSFFDAARNYSALPRGCALHDLRRSR